MTPDFIFARYVRGLGSYLISVMYEVTPRASTLTSLVVVLAVMFVSACSDATPTGPRTTESIDRIAAARVLPSVTDARLRLAPTIVSGLVRGQVIGDLKALES